APARRTCHSFIERRVIHLLPSSTKTSLYGPAAGCTEFSAPEQSGKMRRWSRTDRYVCAAFANGLDLRVRGLRVPSKNRTGNQCAGKKKQAEANHGSSSPDYRCGT